MVRPTLRCVTEDFRETLPPDTVDLGALEHPLMGEALRLAPELPKGQKRIESIAAPLVYRLQQGQYRGATWIEKDFSPTPILWVLASALRREGDTADAFSHIDRLHNTGRLLPSAGDYRRLRVEATARLFDRAVDDLRRLLQTARALPNTEHVAELADCVPARAYVVVEKDFEELWFAQEVNKTEAPVHLRTVLFAAMAEMVGSAEMDVVYSWPTGGTLTRFEVARFWLRERR